MDATECSRSSSCFIFKSKSNGKAADIAFEYSNAPDPTDAGITACQWSTKECTALLNVVSSLNTNTIDWQIVSSLLKEKFNFSASPMDCLMQYRNVADPSINKSNWSKEEVDKLAELALLYDEHEWCTIAEELGTNRTPMQCLQYYQRNLNHRLVRSNNVWTPEEEQLLKQSIEVYGISDWSNVAGDLPGRTSKQCFNRYRRSSQCQDNVINGHWLEEEERLLYFACVAMNAPTSSSFKRSFDELHQLLNDNGSTVGSSSSSDGKKGRKRSMATTGEDENGGDAEPEIEIIPGYDGAEPQFGRFKGWTAVAQMIPGKNDVQCREKWINNLDPTLNTGKYSEEEDALLLQLVERLGTGRWTLVASYMNGRSDASVRARYAVLFEESQGKTRRAKKVKSK